MSTSTFTELTQRVKRFGRSPNHVPGTYMSAAGIQTEIHPTTLARLAVHETKYRRSINSYRLDLESTVHKIRQDQKQLKKARDEYKKRQYHNRRHRMVTSSIIREHSLLNKSPANLKLACDQPKIPEIQPWVHKSSTILKPEAANDLHSPVSKLPFTMSLESFTKSEILDVANELGSNSKLSEMVSTATGSQISESKSIVHAEDILIQDKDVLTRSEVVEEFKEVQHYDTIVKHNHSKTDASSFMDLVRLKNKTGLTKNLNIVDKLINDSRHKQFVYLKKASKGASDQSVHENTSLSTPKIRERKTAVIEQPDLHDDKLDYSDLRVKGDHMSQAKISTSDANPTARASRKPSLPAKHVDIFLKNQKKKTMNYKDEISWRQSLASIRDVHYIRGKDEYHEYAENVIQELIEKGDKN